MKKIIYEHFGTENFDKELFIPIKNAMFRPKPSNGFWASRQDAPFGWKQWCKSEDYDFCDVSEKSPQMKFTLREGAKILEIHSVADVEKIARKYPLQNPPGFEDLAIHKSIDFEKIAEEYDAIELFFSEDTGLYGEMYTWDCDSIVITNPDIIEPVLIKEKSIADDILEGKERHNIVSNFENRNIEM